MAKSVVMIWRRKRGKRTEGVEANDSDGLFLVAAVLNVLLVPLSKILLTQPDEHGIRAIERPRYLRLAERATE